MQLPDAHIVERLTPTYGRQEAVAMARWIAEEDLSGMDTDLLCDRIITGEPLQYIFGHTDWRGLRLSVTPDTLIPRPETAELVDAVGEMIGDEAVTILDVGTGSGCIAIALSLAHPHATVLGCDISEGALEVARANAENSGAKVRFFHTDILQDNALSGLSIETERPLWIVSNPPYICEEERETMERNVLDYEPSGALFVPNDDPLLFYRKIAQIEQAEVVCFEINERFGKETADMLAAEGYHDIKIRKDICGKERIVTARR